MIIRIWWSCIQGSSSRMPSPVWILDVVDVHHTPLAERCFPMLLFSFVRIDSTRLITLLLTSLTGACKKFSKTTKSLGDQCSTVFFSDLSLAGIHTTVCISCNQCSLGT